MYIESHAHIILDGVDYKKAVAVHKNGICEEVIREKLKGYQRRNINFIRDGGDNLGVSLRASQIADEFSIDYRTPVFAIYKKGCYGSMLGKPFETMGEYQELVKEVKNNNGDFIKLMLSGIVDFNHEDSIKGSGLTEAEIKEMIHIAHDAGFSVMGHVNGSDLVKTAVESGVDSVEHGYYMDGECINYLSESSTVWVPTLTPVVNLIGAKGLNDDIIRKALEIHRHNIVLASGKGVNIAAGSDAGAYGVLHGEGLFQELGHLEETIKDYNVEEIIGKSHDMIKEKFRV